MPKDKTQSHELIMKAAREEFLTRGYEAASIRNIAARAGLTGGALYKHFKGKEEIFSALLDPVYQEMLELYRSETERNREILLADGVAAFEENSAESSHLLLDFIYKHFDEFQMMFHAPEGSKYADIREKMVRLEMESSKVQEESAKTVGLHSIGIPEETLHIFFTMSLTPLFEIIEHKLDYGEAVKIVDLIAQSQNYAWAHLIELNQNDGRQNRKNHEKGRKL